MRKADNLRKPNDLPGSATRTLSLNQKNRFTQTKSVDPRAQPLLQPTNKLQRRPAHAKPDFNWLSGPRNGTWKRTCGISCLRSLAPMWRFMTQHHAGNIHQSFATPRYSATPCYALLQLTHVSDTVSKRWRSKKAFNTSPSHIFS